MTNTNGLTWDVSVQEAASDRCRAAGCKLAGHPHLHLVIGDREFPLLASAANSIARVLEVNAERVFCMLDEGGWV